MFATVGAAIAPSQFEPLCGRFTADICVPVALAITS
jgi:hypothetical protein